MLELLHPDVRWVSSDGNEHQGHEGVRQMLAERQRETGGYSVHLDDVFEGDQPGLVIAKGEVIPHGQEHGVAVTWRVRFLGGLVRSVETLLPS